MTLPPSLKERVLEAARQVQAPPRRAPRVPLAAAVALAAAAMAAALYVSGGPHHAAGRPGADGALIVLGVVALAIAVTRWSLPSRPSMLPPPSSQLLAVAIGVPVIVATWLLAWHSAYVDPFTRLGVRCFALTVASAPGPLAVLAMAAPRVVPGRPWLSGAALGAAAGAWAAVVVELWCPLLDPAHVAIGHVAPLVALVLGGALGGQRFLRLRRV